MATFFMCDFQTFYSSTINGENGLKITVNDIAQNGYTFCTHSRLTGALFILLTSVGSKLKMIRWILLLIFLILHLTKVCKAANFSGSGISGPGESGGLKLMLQASQLQRQQWQVFCRGEWGKLAGGVRWSPPLVWYPTKEDLITQVSCHLSCS